MELSVLTPADIAEVMRIERLPGSEATVGRFEADEHERQMADPTVRYVGLRRGEALDGFVILQALDKPTVLLRRIAVARQDAGVGSWLVAAVTDWVFRETDAQGLRLEVALNNPRGRFVYERQGFVEYDADAVHHFLRIVRSRWRQLRAPLRLDSAALRPQLWQSHDGRARMIEAKCHCGQARLTAPDIAEVTECNCSICRRLGARWAHYSPTEVTLPDPQSTQPYVWGDRMLAFHRCRSCGVVTHWQSLDGSRDRMAVNARLVDGLDWATLRIRQFDGADTWTYLDE